jgi:hypothetical protein
MARIANDVANLPRDMCTIRQQLNLVLISGSEQGLNPCQFW